MKPNNLYFILFSFSALFLIFNCVQVSRVNAQVFVIGEIHYDKGDSLFKVKIEKLATNKTVILGLEGLCKDSPRLHDKLINIYGDPGYVFPIEKELPYYWGITSGMIGAHYFPSELDISEADSKWGNSLTIGVFQDLFRHFDQVHKYDTLGVLAQIYYLINKDERSKYDIDSLCSEIDRYIKNGEKKEDREKIYDKYLFGDGLNMLMRLFRVFQIKMTMQYSNSEFFKIYDFEQFRKFAQLPTKESCLYVYNATNNERSYIMFESILELKAFAKEHNLQAFVIVGNAHLDLIKYYVEKYDNSSDILFFDFPKNYLESKYNIIKD